MSGEGTVAYACRLLRSLGHDGTPHDAPDPVTDWAASGAMALTGRADGPPLVSTGAAVAARGALLALGALAPGCPLPGLEVLGERAALAGLRRRGEVSCGGATRLLATADGHVALTLARDDDHALVPALVEGEPASGWAAVERWALGRTAVEVRDRAVLLGLPAAVPGEAAAEQVPWRVLQAHDGPRPTGRPRVVDLSALWAGPLCASLLGLLGCEVLKVEDPSRPDGARRGDPAFFDLLNAGARSVTLDLRSRGGRARLHELVTGADVVIEGSRPRALQQLGIDAADVVAQAPALTWVSLTGHGRDQPLRVGYGDDASVAGGLLAGDDRGPLLVADAVADPLTGLHAALVAWAGLLTGGSRLVDLALARVAATAAALQTERPAPAVQGEKGWYVEVVPVAEPYARAPRGRGPELS